MSDEAIQRKMNRLARGEIPRVLDLFAGCGGLSLGFRSQGFAIAGAIEFNRAAALTHAHNFFRTLPSDDRLAHQQPVDITRSSPEEISERFHLGEVSEAIDVIVGGPPCQAFSKAGRAKLMHIAQDSSAHRVDPRANLYLRYIEYVKAYRPLAVLMENVPDIISFGERNIAQEICEHLDELGYECGYTLLNSVFYGVPQYRERMFLIAYRKELGKTVEFPPATHYAALPKGYEQIRKGLSRSTRFDLFSRDLYFQAPLLPQPGLPPAVTVKDALGDLPFLDSPASSARSARMPMSRDGEISEYAKKMRSWAGFEIQDEISGHFTRRLPRDYPIFAQMRPNDRYPDAIEIAEALLRDRLNEVEASLGRKLGFDDPEYVRIRKATVPPYEVSKFRDKWKKLDPAAPSWTLTAHLSKDCYSHIHPDPKQARTITVREAARLQSFPDAFEFQGSMGDGFRQIGNSVPPVMAAALARKIRETLTSLGKHPPAQVPLELWTS